MLKDSGFTQPVETAPAALASGRSWSAKLCQINQYQRIELKVMRLWKTTHQFFTHRPLTIQNIELRAFTVVLPHHTRSWHTTVLWKTMWNHPAWWQCC